MLAAPPHTSSALLLHRLCFTCGSRLDQVHLLAVETWTQAAAHAIPQSETDAVYFYRAVPIEVEQTREGRDLNRRARASQLKQAQRLQKLIDSAAAKGPALPLLNLAGEIWSMPRFESLFDWHTVPGQPTDGIACIALQFTPKPGLRPASRFERILSRTTGILQLDPATGQVLSGTFHSLGPVGFGGGLLARFSDFSGAFSMQPVPGSSAWVMRKIEVHVQGRELFHRVHGTETMTYAIQ